MKEFKIMCKTVRQAGKKYFLNGSKKINLKSKFDYYTDNDLACEKYIISVIKKYFPEDKILAEETCSNGELQNRTWIIDPIDGTHNYANELKECGIQVAFYDQQEVKFSIIFLPYYKEFYTCLKGSGVYLNGKKIITKKNMELSKSLVSCITFHHEEVLKKILLQILYKVNDIALNTRTMGCACANYVKAVCENYCALIKVRKNINKWDLLPGKLMCEEAGLMVSNKFYNGFEYCIVANNNKILKVIEKIVKDSISQIVKTADKD